MSEISRTNRHFERFLQNLPGNLRGLTFGERADKAQAIFEELDEWKVK